MVREEEVGLHEQVVERYACSTHEDAARSGGARSLDSMYQSYLFSVRDRVVNTHYMQ